MLSKRFMKRCTVKFLPPPPLGRTLLAKAPTIACNVSPYQKVSIRNWGILTFNFHIRNENLEQFLRKHIQAYLLYIPY